MEVMRNHKVEKVIENSHFDNKKVTRYIVRYIGEDVENLS